MVPHTRALERLKACIKKASQAAVAKKLHVGQQTVSAYIKRKARPGEMIRLRAEKQLGIPCGDWLTPRERAEREAAA